MAIYVPGVPEYFPKFEAFTPDYKFLSNVLQAKTTKYSTNYKALNDQYNKVVYGDLSRQDTSDKREQFVNNLGPMLEKVSGMDLSLAENVNSAQALFAPFYEDDMIVKDLVYTKAYQNEIKNAEIMRTSPNEEVRENWWSEGVKDLQYRMQDFINASEDKAMRMGNPTYRANPNIYRRGMKYLQAQGYDVSIESAPKKGNYWIVKNKNGQLITERALNDVKAHLMSDPIVRDGYAAKAFVDSREAAQNLLDEGSVSSIEEGVLSWSINQLEATNIKLANNIKTDEEELSGLKSTIDRWEAQARIGQAPIPGSDDFKKMQEDMMRYNALSVKNERNKETSKQILSTLEDYQQTGNGEPVIGRAWNYLMTSNMEQDFKRVAYNFSNINQELTYKVNQEEKDRLAEIAKINAKLAKEQSDADEESYNLGAISSLGITVSKQVTEEGEVFYTETEKQEDDIVLLNNTTTNNAYSVNRSRMASHIANASRKLEDNGSTVEYITREKAIELGIDVPQKVDGQKIGDDIPIDAFTKILLNEDNVEKIAGIFQMNEIKEYEPGQYQTIKENFDIIDRLENDMYQVYADNLNNLELVDDKYAKLIESGVSKPVVLQEDGTYRMMTRQEFVDKLTQDIKDNKVDADVLQETIGMKEYKTVEIGKTQNGYRVSNNEVLLDPSKAMWVQAENGDYYMSSEAIVNRTPTGFKTDDYLIPKWEERGWKAETFKDGKKKGERTGFLTYDGDDVNLKRQFKGQRLNLNQLNNILKEELNADAKERGLKNANGILPQFRGNSYTTLGLFTADYNVRSGFIYDKQIEFLNKTLSGAPGYDQINEKGEAIIFQQYYQHSAFSGDNVSDNIITTTNVNITGSKGFKNADLAGQVLSNLKTQTDAIASGLVEYRVNGVVTKDVSPVIMNLFDKKIDQKNVSISYQPAAKIGVPGFLGPTDEIKGQYVITEFDDKGKVKNEFQVIFPTSNDTSPLSLKTYQVLDPVMIKIKEGNYKTAVSTPGGDYGLKESVKGGDIILNRNQNGDIYFDLVTYTVDPLTGDYIQDPKDQNVTKNVFSEDQFMIYNNLYGELIAQLEQKARTNAATKRDILKSYNQSNKAKQQ